MTRKSGRGTARQTMRIDEALWNRFVAATGEQRRSEVVRDFIRWFVREPGAEFPERPTGVATELE